MKKNTGTIFYKAFKLEFELIFAILWVGIIFSCLLIEGGFGPFENPRSKFLVGLAGFIVLTYAFPPLISKKSRELMCKPEVVFNHELKFVFGLHSFIGFGFMLFGWVL